MHEEALVAMQGVHEGMQWVQGSILGLFIFFLLAWGCMSGARGMHEGSYGDA